MSLYADGWEAVLFVVLALAGLGFIIWQAVLVIRNRLWIRWTRLADERIEQMKPMGRLVVDRGTGRIGRCCCMGAHVVSLWRPKRIRIGITLADGDHIQCEPGAVRLAIESEREQFEKGEAAS